MIDTSTRSVISTIAVGTNPAAVAVSPTGSTVYVTNGGGSSVSVIDAATDSVTQTIPLGAAPGGVVVSPDGSTVYVVELNGNIAVIDAATNTQVASIAVGAVPLDLAYAFSAGFEGVGERPQVFGALDAAQPFAIHTEHPAHALGHHRRNLQR